MSLKISYHSRWHPSEGTHYDQAVNVPLMGFEILRDRLQTEIDYGFPYKAVYVQTSCDEMYLKPLTVIDGVCYLNHTQTRFINHFLQLPLKDRNTVLLVR